jgi:DNA-binding response OmpR family regulator
MLRAGPLVLDVGRRQVRAAGRIEDRAAELSEEETGVLAALMAQPGRIISARVLARAVRGQEMTEWEAEQLLRPLVFDLCRKLASHAGRPDAIRSARRAGYFLAAD